ncbi:uracil-DNA glycosylase [Acidimicrobiia bacterium]|nr:uracil-DNA glycosylase [Acidimicrobiia bacterium]MDA9275430.1 uracil-DNA glycosylase [Acidimicrobiia bacterium]MDB4249652.1 uracil-DNA glycosylase [Acidimicrobiia bacterium]
MKAYLDIKEIHSACRKCRKCDLSSTRNNVVAAKGNPSAKVFIIGEAPGEKEDITGFPFVGRAGKMLDTVLTSVDIDPLEDCYITNIVKCRPPENRRPTKDEINSCISWLETQIDHLKPSIVILAGSTAVEGYLGIKEPITKVRGSWIIRDGIKFMPIFHPAYLLRNPSKEKGKPKWLTWQDLKKVKEELDLL